MRPAAAPAATCCCHRRCWLAFYCLPAAAGGAAGGCPRRFDDSKCSCCSQSDPHACPPASALHPPPSAPCSELSGIAGKADVTRLQRVWDSTKRKEHFKEDLALRQVSSSASHTARSTPPHAACCFDRRRRLCFLPACLPVPHHNLPASAPHHCFCPSIFPPLLPALPAAQ